jgi:hypothetical protein
VFSATGCHGMGDKKMRAGRDRQETDRSVGYRDEVCRTARMGVKRTEAKGPRDLGWAAGACNFRPGAGDASGFLSGPTIFEDGNHQPSLVLREDKAEA